MNKLLIIFGILFLSTATLAERSYELGLGSSYGGIGVSVNSELNSNTELFTGIGLDLDSVGYVVGSKFWLNDKSTLIASYGTNCIVWTGTTYHAYEGLNLGIGYSFTGKEAGWQFALFYADISECNKNESNVNGPGTDHGIDISIGYRF